MRGNSILPGTGRWQAEGLTEGAPCLAQTEGPLHHALRARSPSPCRGGTR